jgi:hypothetical protein
MRSRPRALLILRTLDVSGGVEGPKIRSQLIICMCAVIIFPPTYSRFYDPEGCVGCGYLRVRSTHPASHIAVSETDSLHCRTA